jgi:hypothetical protein
MHRSCDPSIIAARYSDDLAVSDRERSLTYSELKLLGPIAAATAADLRRAEPSPSCSPTKPGTPPPCSASWRPVRLCSTQRRRSDQAQPGDCKPRAGRGGHFGEQPQPGQAPSFNLACPSSTSIR